MVLDYLKIIHSVITSPKYKHVYAGLIQKIADAELEKGLSLKEATKSTKNKLHQIGGAYFPRQPNYNALLAELEEAVERDPESIKTVCREIMQQHSSTKERLPILDEFYTTIFEDLPAINSVLDVGCGLNPLAAPWMPLEEKARYYACDIYQDMIDFLISALDLLSVRKVIYLCDATAFPPSDKVDLALALKVIPCLEHLDKRIGLRMLEGFQAKYVLVSYPIKSLGGHEKGMKENYETHFTEMIAGKGWEYKKYEFETELAFLLEKE